MARGIAHFIAHEFPADLPLPEIRTRFYQLDVLRVDQEGLGADTHLGGLVLTFAFIKDGVVDALGSGFLVAPGLALTAAHVVSDQVQERIRTEHAYLFGFGQGEFMIAWRVERVLMVGDTALLECGLATQIPSDRVISAFKLSTRAVLQGDRIFMLGFRSQGPVVAPAVVRTRHLVAVGSVTAVYPGGRDRSMLPRPCFEVDVEALGGMSGGPALNTHGEVIGIISTSMQGGPSCVSLFNAVLTSPTRLTWPKRLRDDRSTTLLELAKLEPAEVWISGCDKVTVEHSKPPAATRRTVHVEPWR